MEKRFALLIDSENTSVKYLDTILKELGKYVQNLGQQMTNYDITNKNKTERCSDKKNSKKEKKYFIKKLPDVIYCLHHLISYTHNF